MHKNIKKENYTGRVSEWIFKYDFHHDLFIAKVFISCSIILSVKIYLHPIITFTGSADIERVMLLPGADLQKKNDLGKQIQTCYSAFTN